MNIKLVKKMCSKIFKLIAIILAFIGFFLIVGGVGKADFAEEIGEYMALKEFVPQMVIGAIMIIPSCLAFKNYGVDKVEHETKSK